METRPNGERSRTSPARIAMCDWRRGVVRDATRLADYELYNKDDTKLDLQFMTIGAQFGQDQSWFGESHSFLNVSAASLDRVRHRVRREVRNEAVGRHVLRRRRAACTRATSGDDASGVTDRPERREQDDARAGPSRLEDRRYVYRTRREHAIGAARPLRLFDRHRHVDRTTAAATAAIAAAGTSACARRSRTARSVKPRQQDAEGAGVPHQEQSAARRCARRGARRERRLHVRRFGS